MKYIKKLLVLIMALISFSISVSAKEEFTIDTKKLTGLSESKDYKYLSMDNFRGYVEDDIYPLNKYVKDVGFLFDGPFYNDKDSDYTLYGIDENGKITKTYKIKSDYLGSEKKKFVELKRGNDSSMCYIQKCTKIGDNITCKVDASSLLFDYDKSKDLNQNSFGSVLIEDPLWGHYINYEKQKGLYTFIGTFDGVLKKAVYSEDGTLLLGPVKESDLKITGYGGGSYVVKTEKDNDTIYKFALSNGTSEELSLAKVKEWTKAVTVESITPYVASENLAYYIVVTGNGTYIITKDGMASQSTWKKNILLEYNGEDIYVLEDDKRYDFNHSEIASTLIRKTNDSKLKVLEDEKDIIVNYDGKEVLKKSKKDMSDKEFYLRYLGNVDDNHYFISITPVEVDTNFETLENVNESFMLILNKKTIKEEEPKKDDNKPITCKEVNGIYYDTKGNKVSKKDYKALCGAVKPVDTGYVVPALSLMILGCLFLFTKRHKKLNKIEHI